MKEIIRIKIEDQQLLRLMDLIIDSANNLYDSKTGVGLPIGNLTSQFFANLYLNELDRFVKVDLRQRYYIRYMDDFLVFGNDRCALEAVKGKMRDFLRERLKLTLHEDKSQVFRSSGGITFLGFRLLRDKRRIAAKNIRRVRQRIKEWRWEDPLAKQALFLKRQTFLRCWFAHVQHADSKALRLSVLRKVFGPGGV